MKRRQFLKLTAATTVVSPTVIAEVPMRRVPYDSEPMPLSDSELVFQLGQPDTAIIFSPETADHLMSCMVESIVKSIVKQYDRPFQSFGKLDLSHIDNNEDMQ